MVWENRTNGKPYDFELRVTALSTEGIRGIWRAEMNPGVWPARGDDFAWSSDGRKLAYTVHAANEIRVWDIVTGQVTRYGPYPGNGKSSPANLHWSPDDKLLYLEGDDGYWFMDMSQGSFAHSMTTTDSPTWDGGFWLPDSRSIVIGHRWRSFMLMDIEGHVERSLPSPARDLDDLFW